MKKIAENKIQADHINSRVVFIYFPIRCANDVLSCTLISGSEMRARSGMHYSPIYHLCVCDPQAAANITDARECTEMNKSNGNARSRYAFSGSTMAVAKSFCLREGFRSFCAPLSSSSSSYSNIKVEGVHVARNPDPHCEAAHPCVVVGCGGCFWFGCFLALRLSWQRHRGTLLDLAIRRRSCLCVQRLHHAKTPPCRSGSRMTTTRHRVNKSAPKWGVCHVHCMR